MQYVPRKECLIQRQTSKYCHHQHVEMHAMESIRCQCARVTMVVRETMLKLRLKAVAHCKVPELLGLARQHRGGGSALWA